MFAVMKTLLGLNRGTEDYSDWPGLIFTPGIQAKGRSAEQRVKASDLPGNDYVDACLFEHLNMLPSHAGVGHHCVERREVAHHVA